MGVSEIISGERMTQKEREEREKEGGEGGGEEGGSSGIERQTGRYRTIIFTNNDLSSPHCSSFFFFSLSLSLSLSLFSSTHHQFLFHPVDTVAKRLMSNTQSTTKSYAEVIFRDAASKSVFQRWMSLFPGLGYAAGYKVLQRTYVFFGEVSMFSMFTLYTPLLLFVTFFLSLSLSFSLSLVLALFVSLTHPPSGPVLSLSFSFPSISS